MADERDLKAEVDAYYQLTSPYRIIDDCPLKIRVGRPRTGDASLAYRKLPSLEDRHCRGYIDDPHAEYIVGGEWDFLPLRQISNRGFVGWKPQMIVFHSQPTNDPLCEIPKREDIYWFIRHGHRVHVNVGRQTISVLSKTEATYPTILALRDWELSHPYAKSRIRRRHPSEQPEQRLQRYVAAALRGVGLKWPGKPTDRLKQWPGCLRAIGLTVEFVAGGPLADGRTHLGRLQRALEKLRDD